MLLAHFWGRHLAVIALAVWGASLERFSIVGHAAHGNGLGLVRLGLSLGLLLPLQLADVLRHGSLGDIIAQLGRVDDVFHKYGPSSPEVVPMLRATDARLKRAVAHLKPLGYGVIILADHGQHDIVDDPSTKLKGGHGSDSDTDCQVPCTWM